MHYADGTVAKHGDLLIRRETFEHGSELVGIIRTISPGSDTCNASVIPLAGRQKGSAMWLPLSNSASDWSVTLKECMKLGEMAQPRAVPAVASG